MSDEPDLGNLAQAARGNQLRSARWIMIVIGLMTLVSMAFTSYLPGKQSTMRLQNFSSKAWKLTCRKLKTLSGYSS